MRRFLAAAAIVLAAGTAQAAERRTVEVALAAGPVTVDVHLASPGATPRGGVILMHGLLRSRETMAGFAKTMAERGLVAVAVDAPTMLDEGANASALRELVAALRAGKLSAPVDRVVLVGFSMGGLWSLLAADAPGVAGWVGLDPADLPDKRGLAAARALKVPATLIRAPATPCNAYGAAAAWGPAFAAPAGDTLVPEATHCDFESPTDGWCRFFCGESDPARASRVGEALLAAVMSRFEPPKTR